MRPLSLARPWCGTIIDMKYALFLRGINVGGIRVPMADLRETLAALSLDEIKTYAQTGNVVFTSSLSAAELKPLIERALSERFHYDAFVLLFPFDALQTIVDGWPFAPKPNEHRYIIFCDNQNVVNELTANRHLLDRELEDIAAGQLVVYWRVPIGRSTDTTFAKIAAKPANKPLTTTRNSNTLEKMLAG